MIGRKKKALLFLLFSSIQFAHGQNGACNIKMIKTYFSFDQLIDRRDSILTHSKPIYVDFYENGLKTKRSYAKYEGRERIEEHKYDSTGKLLKILAYSKHPLNGWIPQDSIIYQYRNNKLYSEKKYVEDGSGEKRYTYKGDTTFIEDYLDDEYMLTFIRYRDKIDSAIFIEQIVLPEKSEIINKFRYDQKSNLVDIVHIENGVEEIDGYTKYNYDQCGNMIMMADFTLPDHRVWHLKFFEIEYE
jgi:hypothetical protein